MPNLDVRRSWLLLSRISRGEPVTGAMRPNTLARTLTALRQVGLVELTRNRSPRYALTANGREGLVHLGALVRLTGLDQPEPEEEGNGGT